MEYKEQKFEKPSEEFMNAVCHYGSTVSNCEFCGRVHFETEGDGYEENEAEDLKKKAAAEPDKYIEHSDSSVSWGYLDGKQVVWDCECHKARRFEDWIWNHRRMISEYLNARCTMELKEAQSEHDKIVPNLAKVEKS